MSLLGNALLHPQRAAGYKAVTLFNNYAFKLLAPRSFSGKHLLFCLPSTVLIYPFASEILQLNRWSQRRNKEFKSQ